MNKYLICDPEYGLSFAYVVKEALEKRFAQASKLIGIKTCPICWEMFNHRGIGCIGCPIYDDCLKYISKVEDLTRFLNDKINEIEKLIAELEVEENYQKTGA